MTEKIFIKRMIKAWRAEFYSIRDQLVTMGERANTLEYNLLSAEAMRLSMCINDATSLVLEITEKTAEKCNQAHDQGMAGRVLFASRPTSNNGRESKHARI